MTYDAASRSGTPPPDVEITAGLVAHLLDEQHPDLAEGIGP